MRVLRGFAALLACTVVLLRCASADEPPTFTYQGIMPVYFWLSGEPDGQQFISAKAAGWHRALCHPKGGGIGDRPISIRRGLRQHVAYFARARGEVVALETELLAISDEYEAEKVSHLESFYPAGIERERHRATLVIGAFEDKLRVKQGDLRQARQKLGAVHRVLGLE